MRVLLALATIFSLVLVPESLKAEASAGLGFFKTLGDKAVATKLAPGIAIAVVSQRQIVYEGGFGLADVAAHQAVTANTRFAIGSLTKQLTAAAFALLAGEGKVSRDDALSKYVPSLPNARLITLRMLLDQTSGLHNYPMTTEHDWPLQGSIDLKGIVAILSTDKPDFAPGARWEYSNANYAVLAAVVEKVSGMPYGAFLQARIFTPLHMSASGFGYAAQRSGGIAIGYENAKPEKGTLSLDLYSGAGGAVSSAHDFALWDSGLLRGTLLPASYLDTVWRDGVSTDDASTRYANGWVLSRIAGHRQMWHNGLVGIGGGYCYNAIFPDDGLAVVVFTNGAGAAGLPESVAQQIAGSYGIGSAPEAAPTAAPGDDAAIDALAESFWNQITLGNVDRNKLTSQFGDALTPALLEQVREGVALLGKLRSFTFVGERQDGGAAVYRYALTFVNGIEHEWDVWIAPGGKIAGSKLVR